MFRVSGIDMQSQAAYEFAVKGLMRPANNNIPMVYSIKCVDFTSPEFTLGKYIIAFITKHIFIIHKYLYHII